MFPFPFFQLFFHVFRGFVYFVTAFLGWIKDIHYCEFGNFTLVRLETHVSKMCVFCLFVFCLFWLSCYLFCFVLFCFVLFCFGFVLFFLFCFCFLFGFFLVCFVFVSFCLGGCLCVFSFLTLENGSTLKSLITYTGIGLGFFVCLFVCLFVSSPFNLVNVFCVCVGGCMFVFVLFLFRFIVSFVCVECDKDQ